MASRRAVQTCRWGTPTLFLPWPSWYDAADYHWSCVRHHAIHVIAEPAMCEMCPHWTPGSSAATVDRKRRLAPRRPASGLTLRRTDRRRT
jgi:hypothetical protein